MSGVLESLNNIGPEAAEMAIPCTIRGATNSDVWVRRRAVQYLGAQVSTKPLKVVPVLVKSLGDSDGNVRLMGIFGEFSG